MECIFDIHIYFTLELFGWSETLKHPSREKHRAIRRFRLPPCKQRTCCMTPFLCPCLPIESSYPVQFSSQPPVTVLSAPLPLALLPTFQLFFFPPLVEVFLLRSWHHFLRAGHTHSPALLVRHCSDDGRVVLSRERGKSGGKEASVTTHTPRGETPESAPLRMS